MDTRLYPAMEDRLDWTAKRAQALAANINNKDTPGYHARDVSFSDQLQSIQLRTSSGRHISSPLSDPRMTLEEVPGEADSNNNNVDLDRELTEQGKNGLQYLTVMQFINQKLRTLRSAINEGTRS